jgi:predicted aldo/keto reductase-like oxidoreductase
MIAKLNSDSPDDPCAASTGGAVTEIKDGIPCNILGQTGARVSRIGLGGFHLGKVSSDEESIRILRTAVDAGINFMDNSWDYHEGLSEVRMGKALRDGYRDQVFLTTKIAGRDEQTAQQQLEESLTRLETDCIDLLQFHEIIRVSDPDHIFAPDGAFAAVRAAQKAGKVRFIGFTGHKDPAIHLKMLRLAELHGFVFDAVLMPLNVMDAHYNSFQKLVLPVLLKHNIGRLGIKPLGGLHILRSNTVTAVECLHYAMSLATNVVITGCDSMKILDQALEAARTFRQLDLDEMAALEAKTAEAAKHGEYELYKTSTQFDSTRQHPEWLG